MTGMLRATSGSLQPLTIAATSRSSGARKHKSGGAPNIHERGEVCQLQAVAVGQAVCATSRGMGEGPEGVRVAVVTGVSRRTGIGFAIAQRLLAEGRSVLIHSWSDHDTENAGTDDGKMTRVINAEGGFRR
jgi:hypothetical protein